MDRAAAESHVRLLAESELRRAVAAARYRWLDEDFREGGEPPREAGLLRVRAVLSALGQVGALGRATADRVAMGFTGALAARGLHEPGTLLAPAPPAPPAGAPAAEPRAGVPAGRYQAVPVGVVIPGEQEGQPGEVHVQALVLGPDRAAVVTSFASTWRAAALAPAGGEAPQPSFPPFGGSGMTDDQGRSYRLTLEPGEGGWYETRVLRLSAVPPPGARWLDMPVRPGLSIRIDLTGPPAIRAVREPRSAPSSGELLLGAVADTLLGGGQLAGITATLLAGSLAEVTDALVAVRALSPDSPAADRLAALCLRRAIEVRGPWAGRAPATRLPASWASVLGGSRCQDGRQGVVPAAVVMPEIDGARFVLAGLSSWERQATVLVFAWGWAQAPREFRPRQPFSWWARDDAGRWHVGRARPDGMDGGTFQLELTPPLHPAARSLDIILTGRSDRVTATLPLAWPGQVAGQQDQGTRERPGRPHSPGAPGGHGPRGVRDRASPPGPGDGPAQVGRGRLPRRPAPSARRSPASPASDGPGPVRPPWWAALPPAETRIRCGPGEHVLRWADGRLQALDHDDIEGDLVLAALGGDKAGCVAMLEAWGTHADDLDVLALGPRSPADELAVTAELVDELRAALGPAPRSVPMRPWPAPGPASAGGPGRAHPGPRRQDQGRAPPRPQGSGRCGVVCGRGAGCCGGCRPGGCPPGRNGNGPGAWSCCPCSPWAGTSSCGCPPRWRRPGPATGLLGRPAARGTPGRP